MMNSYKEGFFYFAQNFGSEYGMCCGSQYITDPDAPIYAEQTRIVPKEQLEEIRELLIRKIATQESIRPEQVERYQNTLTGLRHSLMP